MAEPALGRGLDQRPPEILSYPMALGRRPLTSREYGWETGTLLFIRRSKGLQVIYLEVDILSKFDSFQKQKKSMFTILPIVH